MSDRTPQEPGQDDAPLTPDLAWVERLLLAAGRHWRETEPSTDALARHVRVLVETSSASDAGQRPVHADISAAPQARRFSSKGFREPMDYPTTPSRSRWRAVAGALAAVVVVGALATLFIHNASNRGAGAQSTVTSGANTPTPEPAANYQSPLFREGLLTVAPSNPSVVYRIFTNVPQRSTDGGKSFTALRKPTTSITKIQNEWVAVSPLDPSKIFVTIVGTKNGAGCMPASNIAPGGGPLGDVGNGPIVGVALSGAPDCGEQFYSANSGQSWASLNLIGGSVFTGHSAENGLGFPYQAAPYIFQAQGTRLYAMSAFLGGGSASAPAVDGWAHLLASSNGGASWTAIDSLLYGAGNIVCDFAAAPSGSTVYVVTSDHNGCSPDTTKSILWRSNNGGQSWTQVQNLPSALEDGMYVAPSGALYFFNPANQSTSSSGSSVLAPTPTREPASPVLTLQYALVSLDGGATFSHAPSAGIQGKGELLGPSAILSDGAIVYSTPTGLYSWKVGDASWSQIETPSLSGPIGSVIVTPNANGGDTLTITTLSDSPPVTVQVQG
jgi:hypothetical protein